MNTVHVASEVPVGCIRREIQLATGHMGLKVDIDNIGLHTETAAMGEVPKGEDLVLKRRPNPYHCH